MSHEEQSTYNYEVSRKLLKTLRKLHKNRYAGLTELIRKDSGLAINTLSRLRSEYIVNLKTPVLQG